jgi:hypothetical protein
LLFFDRRELGVEFVLNLGLEGVYFQRNVGKASIKSKGVPSGGPDRFKGVFGSNSQLLTDRQTDNALAVA